MTDTYVINAGGEEIKRIRNIKTKSMTQFRDDTLLNVMDKIDRRYLVRSRLRGGFTKECVRGIEPEREVIGMLKLLMKTTRNPDDRIKVAQAAILINEVLLK
jgi:hypothetical protein